MDEARRAARVLETVVGEALGEPPGQGTRTNITTSPRGAKFISHQDWGKFYRMAAHRDLWWPVLAALASYARQSEDQELERMAVRIRGRAVRRAGELLALVESQ